MIFLELKDNSIRTDSVLVFACLCLWLVCQMDNIVAPDPLGEWDHCKNEATKCTDAQLNIIQGCRMDSSNLFCHDSGVLLRPSIKMTTELVELLIEYGIFAGQATGKSCWML